MSKIRILPEVLANRIAAGEVVERPSSVVKELIENSIDAGSRTIQVEAASGGKQLIRVRDDGCGMSRDDALLAFEHHATSKIASESDLMAIATLGFRGEALPAIASVSRLTLRTIESERRAGAEQSLGTEVQISGGRIKHVRDIAWDKGTEVAVESLFFNVPARRKFLKSAETELGHITRLVTHYAIAYPEIGFKFVHQGRELILCDPMDNARERIHQIFGSGFLENLIEFEGAAGPMRVFGLTSRPHEQRANPHSQFFFVNRRIVRDRVISNAVAQAYKAVIPSSVYPVVLLFLELPPEQVDVNVHPAKIEVRFRDSDGVHRLIRSSIEAALLKARSTPKLVIRREGTRMGPDISRRPDLLDLPQQVEQPGRLVRFDLNGGDIGPQLKGTSSAEALPQQAGCPSRAALWEEERGIGGYAFPRQVLASGLRPLGQLRESFIIAVDRDGVLIVDQHVAHERILFEQALAQMRGDQLARQSLLFPVVLDLAPSQRTYARRILDELNRNGFEVELFGGGTIAVRSVPIIAGGCDVRALVLDLFDALENEIESQELEPMRRRIAASVACRAAIKINTPLTTEKMQWLLEELGRTQVPTHCPHGRPILLRLSIGDIERGFKRS